MLHYIIAMLLPCYYLVWFLLSLPVTAKCCPLHFKISPKCWTHVFLLLHPYFNSSPCLHALSTLMSRIIWVDNLTVAPNLWACTSSCLNLVFFIRNFPSCCCTMKAPQKKVIYNNLTPFSTSWHSYPICYIEHASRPSLWRVKGIFHVFTSNQLFPCGSNHDQVHKSIFLG